MNLQTNCKKDPNTLFNSRYSGLIKNLLPVVLAMMIFSLTSIVLPAINSQRFSGEIELGGGLSYSCKGEIIRKNRQVTKSTYFFDENDKLILTEIVTFDANNFEPISLSSEEDINGSEQKIERDGISFHLYYKKNFTDKLSEYTMEYQPLTLHGSNLPVFLSENLDRIGENGFTCHLILVPRKMKIEMKFVNKGKVKVNGRPCYEIQMDAANLVLKPLVKTHYFYFGVDQPHLLYKYTGTIAPTDANGNDLWGTINFSYH